MEFRRFLGMGAALSLASFAPIPETRIHTIDSVSGGSAVTEDETTALDPMPTERGRYGCKSRSMHGEPFYFALPNRDNIRIDCEAGTTHLISRNLGDTSPPPAER